MTERRWVQLQDLHNRPLAREDVFLLIQKLFRT